MSVKRATEKDKNETDYDYYNLFRNRQGENRSLELAKIMSERDQRLTKLGKMLNEKAGGFK